MDRAWPNTISFPLEREGWHSEKGELACCGFHHQFSTSVNAFKSIWASLGSPFSLSTTHVLLIFIFPRMSTFLSLEP